MNLTWAVWMPARNTHDGHSQQEKPRCCLDKQHERIQKGRIVACGQAAQVRGCTYTVTGSLTLESGHLYTSVAWTHRWQSLAHIGRHVDMETLGKIRETSLIITTGIHTSGYCLCHPNWHCNRCEYIHLHFMLTQGCFFLGDGLDQSIFGFLRVHSYFPEPFAFLKNRFHRKHTDITEAKTETAQANPKNFIWLHQSACRKSTRNSKSNSCIKVVKQILWHPEALIFTKEMAYWA